MYWLIITRLIIFFITLFIYDAQAQSCTNCVNCGIIGLSSFPRITNQNNFNPVLNGPFDTNTDLCVEDCQGDAIATNGMRHGNGDGLITMNSIYVGGCTDPNYSLRFQPRDSLTFSGNVYLNGPNFSEIKLRNNLGQPQITMTCRETNNPNVCNIYINDISTFSLSNGATLSVPYIQVMPNANLFTSVQEDNQRETIQVFDVDTIENQGTVSFKTNTTFSSLWVENQRIDSSSNGQVICNAPVTSIDGGFPVNQVDFSFVSTSKLFAYGPCHMYALRPTGSITFEFLESSEARINRKAIFEDVTLNARNSGRIWIKNQNEADNIHILNNEKITLINTQITIHDSDADLWVDAPLSLKGTTNIDIVNGIIFGGSAGDTNAFASGSIEAEDLSSNYIRLQSDAKLVPMAFETDAHLLMTPASLVLPTLVLEPGAFVDILIHSWESYSTLTISALRSSLDDLTDLTSAPNVVPVINIRLNMTDNTSSFPTLSSLTLPNLIDIGNLGSTSAIYTFETIGANLPLGCGYVAQSKDSIVFPNNANSVSVDLVIDCTPTTGFIVGVGAIVLGVIGIHVAGIGLYMRAKRSSAQNEEKGKVRDTVPISEFSEVSLLTEQSYNSAQYSFSEIQSNSTNSTSISVDAITLGKLEDKVSPGTPFVSPKFQNGLDGKSKSTQKMETQDRPSSIGSKSKGFYKSGISGMSAITLTEPKRKKSTDSRRKGSKSRTRKHSNDSRNSRKKGQQGPRIVKKGHSKSRT